MSATKKSSKTFIPEYEVLHRVPEVFWGNEHEYENLVKEQGLPPFLSVYHRLATVLVRRYHNDPEELYRLCDEFAKGHGSAQNNPQYFRERIFESIQGGGEHPDLPAPISLEKRLEEIFNRCWPTLGRDRSDQIGLDGSDQIARKFLDWLNDLESPDNPGSYRNIDREVGGSVGPGFEPLPEGADGTFALEGTDYLITRRLHEFYAATKRSGTDFIDGIEKAMGINIEELIESGKLTGVGLPNWEATGTDGCGAYLPFHAFAFSRKTPWGIYIFADQLFAWTASVWLKIGKKHSIEKLFELLFLVVYRHEMFHYHVERHAFMLEVSNRQPHYRPYVEKVRALVSNTEQWLEESLAQAVVLKSRFVKGKTTISAKEVKELLRAEFSTFGNGYKHFDCKWTGGVAQGHRRLGTQIARGMDVASALEWVTDLSIPKTEYTSDFAGVPGYLAWKQTTKSQFQFQTPKMQATEKFWRSLGGQIDKKTASSHERWTDKEGTNVQVVNRDGDIDLNSLKKMAKLFNTSTYQLKKRIQGF